MSKRKIKLNLYFIKKNYDRFKSRITKDAPSLKKRLPVFLVFVFLSSLLWVYRALDDTFVASIKFPIKYQNLPKNKILIDSPPPKFKLQVKGLGYDLLSNKLKFKKPLNFNINSFLLYTHSNDSMNVYVLTRFAKEALTEELNKKNTNLEIVSITPDTIFFNFTQTITKKIAVVPSIEETEETFARQHIQNGPAFCNPDSITVTGPAYIIDTITHILTKEVSPTELTDTFRRKTSIIRQDELVYSNSKVEVIIPTDKFTEISYEIPLYTRHVPDSINMKLFPRKVKVSFNITHSNIPKANEFDFRVYVDYNQLIEKPNSSRLDVELIKIPEYAIAPRFSPASVEYINEINNAKNRNNRGNR